MAWPDPPDEKILQEFQEKFKDIHEQSMRCPHCDELVFKADVKELGYCPECEETIENE